MNYDLFDTDQHTQKVSAFLKEVLDLSRSAPRQALFHIFDVMDTWMSLGKLLDIDDVLRTAPIAELPTEVALGFLSSTLPMREHLSYSPFYRERLRMILKERGMTDDDINELLMGV